MAETKTIKANFSNHVPMGTMATFTHDKQLWIALPAKKNQAIFALVTRLIGIHDRIAEDMIGWINRRPQDAELITQVLERASVARELTKELNLEKIEAFTQ